MKLSFGMTPNVYTWLIQILLIHVVSLTPKSGLVSGRPSFGMTTTKIPRPVIFCDVVQMCNNFTYIQSSVVELIKGAKKAEIIASVNYLQCLCMSGKCDILARVPTKMQHSC